MNDFYDFKVSGDKNLYTKLEQGESKLRILSDIVGGYEGWFQQKPVRFRQDYKITPDEAATLDKDQYDASKSKWRPFGVCIVWNYTAEAVQIWQFTPKGIITALQSLGRDDDWGDLKGYDIKITKTGTGTDTRYEVKPVAPKAVSADIKKAFEDSGLAPEQVFMDQKNLDNIKAFHGGLKGSEDTIQPGDIAF